MEEFMSRAEVAKGLVDLCRSGKCMEVVSEVNGPYVGDDKYGVELKLDFTFAGIDAVG
jgi:hypothetical protein